MGSKKKLLIKGKVYHIYNKGNNSEILFRESQDFEHFLRLVEKYITLVAEIYVWVLMPNHFHLLVRIKEENEIEYLKPIIKSKNKIDDGKWKTISKNLQGEVDLLKLKKPRPIRQFSHLFNAYAKYFNKKHNRTGSLFQKSFSRKIVKSKTYFKFMVYYIHHNPVHHGFVEDMLEYPWSSYLFFPSPKESFLNRDEVVSWFDNIDNFKNFHVSDHDFCIFNRVLFD